MYQSGVFDVVGLNYHHEVYADFQKNYPGKAFIGAENMSALATRGHYDLPSDTMKFWPQRSPMKYVEGGNPDYTVSAYDQVAAYWGSSHETTWKIIKKHDFLSGLFVWTGFDYLGEPVPIPGRPGVLIMALWTWQDFPRMCIICTRASGPPNLSYTFSRTGIGSRAG